MEGGTLSLSCFSLTQMPTMQPLSRADPLRVRAWLSLPRRSVGGDYLAAHMKEVDAAASASAQPKNPKRAGESLLVRWPS